MIDFDRKINKMGSRKIITIPTLYSKNLEIGEWYHIYINKLPEYSPGELGTYSPEDGGTLDSSLEG